MFSLFGLCSLLFFLYLRPQEAITALQALPMLNLCALLGGLGLVIDLRLGRAVVHLVPGLRWALLMAVWGLTATIIKGGGTAFSHAMTRIMIPGIVFLLIAHGVSTFRGLQVVFATVLSLGLAIAAIGVHQAQQPFACFQVKDSWADREMAAGKNDGRPCESNSECYLGDAEPGSDYLCERPGLMGTASIGHGRVRFRGVLQDPNELALAIGIVLPFAIAFWERRRVALRALLAIGAISLVGLCTVYTQSRGGQLVFLTVLGVYFVRRYGLAAGAIVGSVAAVPMLLLGGRSGTEADSSANERTEALYAGIDMIRSSPLFGVGITGFADHHYITAHNAYLLAVAEMGFPGFFCWSSLLYVSIKTLLMALRRYGDRPEARQATTWALALLAAFCGLFVGIFFLSFTFHVVLFIYLGLCGAFYQACRRHDEGFIVDYSVREMLLIGLGDVALVIAIFVYTRVKGT